MLLIITCKLFQEKCDEIGDKGVMEIKRKAAFNLFCQRRFDEWLEIHAQIKTGEFAFKLPAITFTKTE